MKKTSSKRFYVIYFFMALLFAVVVSSLYSLQIKNGEENRQISDRKLSLAVTKEAPRGEICDRYGRPLVTNKTGYFIEIKKINETQEERNQNILNLLRILDRDSEYKDSLPITENEPFKFIKKEENFGGKSADEVIEELCEKYKIDKSLTPRERRLMAGVRYGMEQEGFSATVPYVVMENAGIKTVTKIKENSRFFSCVTVEERPVREYLYPETAVHIIGRTGKISQKEYEEKKEQGYKRNSHIGKQGAEKAFEKYLKGTDGVESAEKNLDFDDTEFIKTREAIQGNTVFLTIDLDIQQAVETALEEEMSKRKKSGGAVVVTEVDTGEILASASYPDYDINTFSKEYDKMAEDAARPMFNRVFSGLYEPGSTFKPISAIAAIDSGVISPEEKITTKGKYEYLDHTFLCNIYKKEGKTHGRIDISGALEKSCNYFFFDVARKSGIEKISQTAEMFGLGETTGSELVGEEAKGKIASKEAREKEGKIWYPGDTLQASIGQSDNLFTPLGLANYAATLANGGTNYKTTLLKAVKEAKTNEFIKVNSPVINKTASVSKQALSAVKDGMQKVCEEDGTAGSVFSRFQVKVAGKTGSAQVKSGTNGLFICYAPAQNPQIAVCVVLENGETGTNAAKVGKKVLEAYFQKPEKEETITEELPYTLLP